ncbi:MAG: ferritin-like domain-containing protein [Gammaproteobacteria bacterium AqS3]|nr:ferritin-like domain-containing protein [Gammaproteobacteria bacterium AqS3]
MKITRVDETPQEIIHFDDDGPKLEPQHIEDIAEIFQTPLTGAYNWDYTIADTRIKKLYELGKELNWNANTDIEWNRPFPRDEFPAKQDTNELNGYQPYDDMSPEKKLEMAWHLHSWTQSQFLHGEQGALLVASQLVSCAPTYTAKLYAASQTFDEARHVEVYNRYLQEQVRFMWPISPYLKALLDKILTDERWDLKFIGMQIIIEGLALAAFNTAKITTRDPLLYDIVSYVIRDEARHVTFGVNYLEEYVSTLSDEERDDRGMFAYEACVIMRERLMPTEVWSHFGLDAEDTRRYILEGGQLSEFRQLLFSRVIPNLKRIGLLTDKVIPHFDQLGLLDYEEMPDDSEIDWAEMTKPLEEKPSAEMDAESVPAH